MGQFLQANHTITTMYKLVFLSACVATTFSQAVPIAAYAGYGAGYPGAFAGGYAAGPAAYAAAPAAYAAAPAIPAAYAASLPAPAAAAAIPAAGLGLPEAATYGLPAVRQVAKAPIVENFIEPVEQWGYKVAY